MKKSSEIREEILEKVKEYYSAKYCHEAVPFKNGINVIPFAGRIFNEKELINLVDSSLDFWLTTGRYAEEFEANFANFMEQDHCILVNSGSSANLLALTALTSNKLGNRALRAGDEVITIAAGFPTTVNPIFQNNLTPVFVDVNIETFNIDTTKLEAAYSNKTKAVMIAHTLGNPFNLTAVTQFCKKYNLFLVEDCCDAVGSKYDGKMVGTFGDIATVSFYPAHHMTMGEGGAVLTRDMQLAKIVTSFRDWGRDCYCGPGSDNTCGRRFTQQFGTLPIGYDHKYVYSHIGYNLKLTDMQASVGVAQMEKLDEFIRARKENFDIITSGLKKYEESLILPKGTEKSEPSWFGYLISVRENSNFTKQELVLFLEEHKVMTRQLFAGNITRQPAYQGLNYRIAGDLKNTDFIMNNSFFIGVYPGINKEKINYILNVFNNFFSIRYA